MTLYNAKLELRGALIKRRDNIKERTQKDKAIHDKLLGHSYFLDAQVVLIYVSKKGEIDTHDLIEQCFRMGKRVAVPRVNGNNMTFFEIEGMDELAVGNFGVLEPTTSRQLLADIGENAVCVVPCLASNKEGYRLGYGKGYYDRFLSGFHGRSVCLCYKENILNIPVEEQDIPVDLVLTD